MRALFRANSRLMMPYPRELPEKPFKFNYTFARKATVGIIVMGAGFICLSKAIGKYDTKIPRMNKNDPYVIAQRAKLTSHMDNLPPAFLGTNPQAKERLLSERKEYELHRDLRKELKDTKEMEGEHKHFVYTKTPESVRKEEAEQNK